MRLEMLSHDDFKELVSEQEGPLVSLYVPLASEGANDGLKRVTLGLSQAEAGLQSMGLSAKGCAQFLAPAKAYAEKHLSVPHGGKTLAMLLSPSQFYSFILPEETPMSLQVGAHFCVAPLLPHLRKHADCHLLVVSKKHARLLHLKRDGLHEVEVDGMPKSFDQAFEGMEHQDKELQSHSSGSGAPGSAMFHGQGGAKDLEKQELDEYMHKIAKAVDHALKDEKAPLFFAGIEEEFGMLRKHLSYPQLQQHFIHGNPDTVTAEDLSEKALDLMRPLWQKEREVALEVYGPLAGTGRTSTDIQAILDLSYHGKVDGLLVAEGAMQWGSVSPDSGIAELHETQQEGDSELLGLAAVHTLQHKGWVRALPKDQMPEKAVLAAVLRY